MENQRSGIVAELEAKHRMRLARAKQELAADEKRMKGQCSYISDLLLFWKWAYRVGKGWYGFNLGHVAPVWTDILDEFLAWVESRCPDFEIHQIKMKLGSLRVYIGTNSSDEAANAEVRMEIAKLRTLLILPREVRKPQKPTRSVRRKRQQPSRKP